MLPKDEAYFQLQRTDIAAFIEQGQNKILEIGCASGCTAEILKKEGKVEKMIGIELVPEIADRAKGILDQVMCGDIETIELPFPDGYFDYIIAADVLEHLRDPWAAITRLKFFLKKGGGFIVSIPNIRYWRIIRDLFLKGEWKYCDSGALDDTHLRFFTKKSICELFSDGFYNIETYAQGMGWKSEIANRVTFRVFEDLLATQYIAKANRI
jgi:SAM-dependent methyltransferase